MKNKTELAREQLTNEEQMARGSAWMTVGNIGSRLLGAVYILPWYAWMGEHAKSANAMFNMGYNIYALFLMISTAGIPSAIAKQTAHYNSLNEYGVSRKLFIRALQLMSVFGVIAAGAMWILSPWLAHASGGGDELIPTMRSLSVAILVFPCMSVIRGYFQGFKDMRPFAISQIVEQVARVFYMLLATFIIMKVAQGDYTTAVMQSTFAAFIGVLAGLAVLVVFLKKEQLRMDTLVEYSNNEVTVNTKELLVETIREAIPFIIVGSGITIFKLVDQFTFIKAMQSFTEYSTDQLTDLFSIFSANPDKLTMVVIGLATSIAATGLPLITTAKSQGDRKGLAKLISNNLQLIAFIMLPATFGMVVLAYPLNTLFYEPDVLGSRVLIQAAIAGLFIGLFMLTSSMLQGLYENKVAIQYLAIGLAIKLVLQYPFIRAFEVYGPLLTTMIAFAVVGYLNLRKLHEISRFNFKFTARRILLISLLTLIMFVVALFSRLLLGTFLDIDSKSQSFIMVLLVGAIGGGLYGYLALKVRLADQLLGSAADKIRRKLRLS
ncbi:MAG: oligosaccharide flippase family protein [Enterococcus sp.]